MAIPIFAMLLLFFKKKSIKDNYRVKKIEKNKDI